jgi:hypothetical protein
VPEDPLDHREILDRGEHPHLPTAPPASLDLDPKHPLQPLRPRDRLTLRRLAPLLGRLPQEAVLQPALGDRPAQNGQHFAGKCW